MNFDKVSAVLGHIASKKEILVDPVKIDTVSNGERPRASAESKRFFWFSRILYFWKISLRLQPLLTKLTRKKKEVWMDPQVRGEFSRIKEVTRNGPCVNLIWWDRKFGDL